MVRFIASAHETAQDSSRMHASHTSTTRGICKQVGCWCHRKKHMIKIHFLFFVSLEIDLKKKQHLSKKSKNITIHHHPSIFFLKPGKKTRKNKHPWWQDLNLKQPAIHQSKKLSAPASMSCTIFSLKTPRGRGVGTFKGSPRCSATCSYVMWDTDYNPETFLKIQQENVRSLKTNIRSGFSWVWHECGPSRINQLLN